MIFEYMIFNLKKFLLELIGISLVVLILISILISLIFGLDELAEVLIGYFVSLIIFIFGFFSINWAFKKSLKTFMVTVLGGMFLRFVLIGVALFLFVRFSDIHILYFILSFFIFYIIYQIYEIRFINLKLSKGKKWLTFFMKAS